MKNISEDVRTRAAKIKLLLMDCDGVLTDGRLYYNEHGEEIKAFNIKDGHGIVSLHRAGIMTGIITGRKFGGLQKRTKELGMKFLREGCGDKVAEFNAIIADAGVTADETAYIGDDIPDLEVMRIAGLGAAVADSANELFDRAHYVTEKPGGCGAVREVADLILKCMQK